MGFVKLSMLTCFYTIQCARFDLSINCLLFRASSELQWVNASLRQHVEQSMIILIGLKS